MGQPMPNHHSTSVESGTTTRGPANGDAKDGASLTDLISQKKDLEAELSALSSVLDSHGVNMQTGLTTLDGFPRADIDVTQIRTTRARIIYLKNDYKALMARIESGLHAHFAAGANATPDSNRSSRFTELGANTQGPPSGGVIFARVSSVVSGSPAYMAGLRAGDGIETFGDADWLNHENLSKVAQVVSQHEGVILTSSEKGTNWN